MTEKITAEHATVLLFGARQICEGLNDGIFEWSLKGIYNNPLGLTPEKNAYDFLYRNYDTIAGTVRIIAGITEIVTDAITNGTLIMKEADV